MNIDNPNFTFVAGDNVTIKPDASKNQITISADKEAILSDANLQFGANAAANDGGKNPVSNKLGSTVEIVGAAAQKDHNYSERNLTTTVDQDDKGKTTITVKMERDLEDIDTIVVNGKDGKDGLTIKGKDGKDGSIGIAGEDGTISHITVTEKGVPGVNGKNGETTTRIVIDDKPVATLDDGMKYTGDFGNGAAVKLNKTVNVVGEAKVTDPEKELTKGNIGVVADQDEENGKLTIKLKKDIDLGDEGSVTIGGTKVTNKNITVGDTVITNNSVTTENVTATTNITTPQITLGDTKITYEGGTTNRIKYGDKYIANTEDVAWTAYVGSVADGNKAGTVNIDNPNFTFVAGDNVTIKPEAGKNQITIAAIGIEAGDGIAVTKDSTTNKYKISLNIEGGVTPTDTVTVNSATSSGSETTGGETSGSGAAGEGAADSGTAGSSTDTGKTVTITSDTNSTAFTDDKGETYVTVKPTSIDDKTSAANNLQINGDGKNISTVATSNGQDEGGSIEVQLKDDITVENITVNNTITGDTINATTVNGDTVNTQTIKLGDTTIEQGDDNRITYKTEGGDTYNIATLEDGMDYAGDDEKVIHKNLSEKLDVVGGAKDKASEYNIYTYNDDDKLRINLAKDIKGVDSVTVNRTINVGGSTTITGDTITTKVINGDTFKAGDTTINNNGLTIKNGPSITKNGVDAGGKKITNVAPGEDGTDAVNVDQLNAAMNQTGDVINRLGDQISKVDNRMKKGLAGAAALAALHPLEFDPDDKLTFAAGLGNYRGQNAAAVGAFYRPDEKVMFSVGGTVGNGENMVNAGISFSLDRVPHVTNTKAAMAREILDLRREVLELKASMASGNWMLDPTLTRLFPDTEENHWAYEYVKTLAGNHIIEGYPDGEFKGDQMITRYEMAAILYRAMMNGAKLPDKALNEFADELGRFRVDRIYGNGDDRHKVERIRVNDENRNDRDVYGSRYEYFNQHPGANVSTGALPGTKQAERAAKAEAAAKQNEKPSVVSHSEKAAG